MLSNSGRMYSVRDGRVLFPPPGKNYPTALPEMARDGRMVMSAWPHSTPMIDAAVGKPVFSDSYGGYRLVSQPGGRRAFVGGQNLVDLSHSNSPFASIAMDKSHSPSAVPGVGVDIPPDHLLRWVKLVIRGEFDENSEFHKWDEQRWEAERQELARLVPHHPDFPFPGPVAADKSYWLFQEYADAVRLERFGGESPALRPALDRLVREAPSVEVLLTRARLHVSNEEYDAGVKDIGEAEKLLGSPLTSVWYRSMRTVGPPVGDGDPERNRSQVALVLGTPGLKPETYRAAFEAHRRFQELPRGLRDPFASVLAVELFPALFAYREGKYDDALAILAELELDAISRPLAAYAVPANVGLVAGTLQSRVRERGDYRQPPMLDLLVLRALVLAKLGRADDAQAVWQAAKKGIPPNLSPSYMAKLQALAFEAEQEFAPPRPPK